MIIPPVGIYVTRVKLILHSVNSPTTFKVEFLLNAIVVRLPAVRF